MTTRRSHHPENIGWFLQDQISMKFSYWLRTELPIECKRVVYSGI